MSKNRDWVEISLKGLAVVFLIFLFVLIFNAYNKSSLKTNLKVFQCKDIVTETEQCWEKVHTPNYTQYFTECANMDGIINCSRSELFASLNKSRVDYYLPISQDPDIQYFQNQTIGETTLNIYYSRTSPRAKVQIGEALPG